MNIKVTAIQREIDAILSSGSKPTAFDWDITIHAGGKDIKPTVVLDVETVCKFTTNFADELSVNVLLMEGDLNYSIIPNKSTLEVTVRKLPLQEGVVAKKDDYSSVKAYRYRGTLYKNNSSVMEGNQPNLADSNTANVSGLKTCRIQLVEPVIERLRMQSVGGIFKDILAIDLVRYILTKYSSTSDKSATSTIKGVTVSKSFNKLKRKHISIPHLTPVIEAPNYIHQHAGGVYATGFHYYLRKNYWYVYTPYDVDAYNSSERSMTLILVPANRLPSPERSYRETPTQLFVLGTGDSKHIDESEQQQLNQGNGVRFIDASKVFDDWGTVDDNKLTVKRSANVNEVMAEPRGNNLNYIKESGTRITTNYMREYSALALKSGSFIQHTWENAEIDLIYPGMPVKVFYIQNNIASEAYGVLVEAHAFSTADTKGMSNRRFNTKVVMTVFIGRKLNIG